MTYKTPGVYVTEGTRGAIPQGLSSHDEVYMLGYAGANAATKGKRTTVVSANDFYNQLGASYSMNSVLGFFRQKHGKSLVFVNVLVRVEKTMSVATPTAGVTYSLTIDGYTVNYLAVTGDTSATILAALADQVNATLSLVASVRGTTIRYNNGTVITASGVTLGTASTNTYPVLGDILDELDRLPAALPQGFIIAPEFFQRLSVKADRQALANYMDVTCRKLRWCAIVDCGSATATATTAGGAIAGALDEIAGMASPNGNMAYFFPYAVDTNDNQVPMSGFVAGVALRRFQEEGYIQPPAGASYPLAGVKSFTVDVTDTVQDNLNLKGVNCARAMPQEGNVIWGARTLSQSPYFIYINVRVVLNVIEATLQRAYRTFLFTTRDGNGVLYSRVISTANAILELVRSAGGLFGSTAAEAYLVVCDSTNNSPINVTNGLLAVDVYVKVSPIVEFIVVNVKNTYIGDVFSEVSTGATPDEKAVPNNAGNSNGNT